MNIKDMLSSTSSGGEFGLPHTVVYEDSLDAQGKVLYKEVVDLLKTPYLEEYPELIVVYPFPHKGFPFGFVVPGYEEGGKVRESFDEFLFENNEGLHDAVFALLDYTGDSVSGVDDVSDSASDNIFIPEGSLGISRLLALTAKRFADKGLYGVALESKVKESLAESGKFTDPSIEASTAKVLDIISKARKGVSQK